MSKKIKRIRYKIYFLFLFIITLASVFVSVRQYMLYRDLDLKVKKISQNINKELLYQKEIKDKIKNYDSDSNIEKLARNELGFVKSDEIIFFNNK
jgi:cell division protein FtsB